MDVVEAIRKRIKGLAWERHMSINGLAEYSGIPPSSLKAIMHGRSNNPTIITIKILCDGLGITLAQFFDTPEFNELEQHIR